MGPVAKEVEQDNSSRNLINKAEPATEVAQPATTPAPEEAEQQQVAEAATSDKNWGRHHCEVLDEEALEPVHLWT